MLPVVAIVGRPNVGKSSLFNAVTGGKKALVHNMPGVTRDRLYDICEINGKKFLLVDTGGFIPDENETLEKLVKQQALTAIEEADLVLAVLDIRAGLTSIDKELVNFLRKQGKEFLTVLNKADTKNEEKSVSEFYELGKNEFFLVSAAQKRGLEPLFEKIESLLPEYEYEEDENSIKIGLLGRPNVGKSSLTNKILGFERVIVSDIPGTTRDSVDTVFKFNNKDFLLIDTAGIRRKSKISYKLEKMSVIKAITTIERSDVLFLMVDASEGITHQDKALAHLIDAKGKGVALVLNKWDKIKERGIDEKKYISQVKKELQFVNYAPVLKVSALTGMNVKKTLNYAVKIYNNSRIRVPTSQLNRFLEYIKSKYSHPAYKGRQIKINFMTQVDVEPPKFVFFCNFPEGIRDSYKKYIQNQLRANFNFEGVPLKIFFKRK